MKDKPKRFTLRQQQRGKLAKDQKDSSHIRYSKKSQFLVEEGLWRNRPGCQWEGSGKAEKGWKDIITVRYTCMKISSQMPSICTINKCWKNPFLSPETVEARRQWDIIFQVQKEKNNPKLLTKSCIASKTVLWKQVRARHRGTHL
jgi:hypothetical protein